MNKYIRCGVLFVTVLNLIAGAAFAPAAQGNLNLRITQIDTSQFPQVTFYVSVTDSSGNPYAVDPHRFVIKENGQEIPADKIVGVGDVGSITTLLVMDVSGSMDKAHKLDSAKAAAHKFVERMRKNDQAGLISFNTKVQVVQDLTSDKDALNNAIDSLEAEHNTAMYDALVVAIDRLKEVNGRKAIIVLTDGLDNSSRANENTVIKRIGPAGLSISTVGLGIQGSAAMNGIDESGLKDLADRAGGVYAYATDEESLTRLYDTYATSLQSEYAITYTSPSKLRDGVSRALSVELAAVGGEPVGTGGERYNPGGLVPEVAQPASWPLFGVLVVVLAAAVLVPMLLLGNQRTAARAAGPKATPLIRTGPKATPLIRTGPKATPLIRTKPRPRIKFKD